MKVQGLVAKGIFVQVQFSSTGCPQEIGWFDLLKKTITNVSVPEFGEAKPSMNIEQEYWGPQALTDHPTYHHCYRLEGLYDPKPIEFAPRHGAMLQGPSMRERLGPRISCGSADC